MRAIKGDEERYTAPGMQVRAKEELREGLQKAASSSWRVKVRFSSMFDAV
jgi:hypothetical protein